MPVLQIFFNYSITNILNNVLQYLDNRELQTNYYAGNLMFYIFLLVLG